MTPRKIASLASLALVIFVAACSVLKKDNHEKEVRDFLTRFQTSLKLSESDLLNQYFHSTQPRETIMAALRVLQNKSDSASATCNANFSLASITFYEDRIMVSVPVSFVADIPADDKTATETQLILWLVPKEKDFVISEIEGEKFYQTYTAVRNAIVWAGERKLELQKRAPIYATADSLQNTLDTVIWYAPYKEDVVFYAVNGEWSNYFNGAEEPSPGAHNMGMVNSKGDTLIPFEYDLIGTIAFDYPSLVEVKRDSKYGYFNLDSGKLVVETSYDMIIPYNLEAENAWALVVKDGSAGWLDFDLQYFDGYPSEEAMSYADNYKYLNKKIVLKAGNQIFCEIPSADHAGEGIIIPPSYFVVNRLFHTIIAGINTTKVPMNGWTDSIEKNSIYNKIGDNIQAFINVVSERYLGGREEFYGESEVTFMDDQDQVLATTTMPTDQEIVFSHVDEYTLELRASSTGYYYYVPGNERDIPVYKYFRMGDDSKLVELPSNRIFTFTEYVKIDSSYLTGPFSRYAPVTEEVYEEYVPEEVEEVTEEESAEEPVGEESEEESEVETEEEPMEEYAEGGDYEEFEEDYSYDPNDYETLDFLTLPTIQFMRDEILAAYGVRPADFEVQRRLENQGHEMKYDTMEEVAGRLTDIDKHNVAFLDRVIALMNEQAF